MGIHGLGFRLAGIPSVGTLCFYPEREYLQEIYPVLKGAAQFYLDMLISLPGSGYLVTAPSNSPELGYRYKGKIIYTCMGGPTIDNQILRELFENTRRAAEIWGG